MKVLTKIILLLLATIWIEYNQVPTFPIGFVVLLFLLGRKITLKQSVPFIIAMILGFVGTGISWQIFNETKIDPLTEKRHYFSKYLLGFNFGIKNIKYLLSQNTITIYQDTLYEREHQLLDAYLKDFVKNYNRKTSKDDYQKKLFRMIGLNRKIEDMYYLGHREKHIPNAINPIYIPFVYKVKFEEEASWKYIYFDITCPKKEVTIVNIEIQNESLQHEIKARYINLY